MTNYRLEYISHWKLLVACVESMEKQLVEVEYFVCDCTTQSTARDLFYLKIYEGEAMLRAHEKQDFTWNVFKTLECLFSFVDTTASHDLPIFIQWITVGSLRTEWMGGCSLLWRGSKDDGLLEVCRGISFSKMQAHSDRMFSKQVDLCAHKENMLISLCFNRKGRGFFCVAFNIVPFCTTRWFLLDVSACEKSDLNMKFGCRTGRDQLPNKKKMVTCKQLTLQPHL